MRDEIQVSELLSRLREVPVLDVRAPGEYLAGHIPGALNLPLFDDIERARVGTAYKQQSPEVALLLGLEVAGSHMREYVEKSRALLGPDAKETVLHCWRGGKRSEAMAWLLRFAGFSVRRLHGGYKAFRQTSHEFFASQSFTLNIVGGCTGAGKTEVLRELAEMGEQVIDLEGMANHKGSAFGSIGELPQPTNEQFENELFLRLRVLDPSRPVWLENESKNIGRVYLPEAFWRQMRDSVLYSIEVDPAVRLERAIGYYAGEGHTAALLEAFGKIKKRLGGLEYQQAVEALEAGNILDAARIALAYYDKSYLFQLSQWPEDRAVKLEHCEDVRETANRLVTASRIVS
jgi:tRNA 2-selenouridine synthase